MLWLVLVLLSVTQPADQKLFRLEKLGPEYYRFLNHGFKAGQVTREQAKLKVDILGKVLKKHVTQLRTGSGLEADLVFLVDSSASVGAENFYNEIKFIRKLLADFTVSHNTTRVVVITYSSVNQVIRQVDHMSFPDIKKHKCKLFEEEIPAITYNSGGTYTLGALLEAQKVFEYARPKAKKAVFLITDGYSNGGDPRPAAEKLKEIGVEFYTFGIRNGNVKELYDMASEPRQEHSFIVDSFEEFEALARRALHKDLGSSTYLHQDEAQCAHMCPTGSDCCDDRAECACGAHSGFYSCICPEGHYGRGLKGDCHKCPAGTYKPRPDPGDRRSCIKCPGLHQTSPPGSSSLQQCVCKEGYELKSGVCKVMDCPHLLPPDNGYFIRNECNNVFNAACGIRCNSGYQLSGSSIRLCLPSGQWSGDTPTCKIKTCRPMKPPNNGYVSCSTNNYEVDTVCEFGCNFGYRLLGSKKRLCLPISLWGGLPAYCKPIKCPRLRKPNYGDIYPSTCSTKKMSFGNQCAFACKKGFQLQGPSIRQCKGKGSWSGGPIMTRCVDVEPPTIVCPHNGTLEAEKNLYYATASWGEPRSKDNSGFHPLVTSVPVVMSPMLFKIGTTEVRYFSEDLTGNKNFCVFSMTVLDTQPPVVDFCESPPEFITDTEDVDIEWDEPIFHDNSRETLSISQTHTFGRFKFGETDIVYIASDSSGNTAECKITVSLQRHPCTVPNDPINGHRNCTEDQHAVQCTLACEDGFAFAFRPTGDYFCEVEGPGTWLPPDNVLPFPDCSVAALSSVISIPTDLTLSVVSSRDQEEETTLCDDSFFLKQVADHVRKKVLHQLEMVCGDSLYCDVMDLEAICGEVLEERRVLTNEIFRKKRDTEIQNTQQDEDFFMKTLSIGPGTGDRRQLIEIVFKLVGKFKKEIEKQEQQQLFVNEVSTVQYELADSSNSGTLDLVIGKDLLLAQEILFSSHEFLCSPGSISQGNSCVNCPVGTFFNIVTRECSPCTAGSYQPMEAQDTCLVCPGRTFTAVEGGATDENQCKAQCRPGTYSKDGLEICRTCLTGFYQTDYAQTECQSCQAGYSTLLRGANSVQDCKEECPPGRTSETGLEPCFPCPKGYFQAESGTEHCYKCPNKTTTIFQASFSIEDCIGLEHTELLEISDLETLSVNDCFALPCHNEATCVPLDIGFTCSCPPGYQGSLCDIQADPCLSSPCLNHGTCSTVVGDYVCHCEVGYTGQDCEIDINECEGHKCENNATCYDLTITDYDSASSLPYYCECEDGFQGEYCEENINDCQNHGCENGGQCIDGLGTFSCVCAPGFTGRLCEDEVDDCASQPCHEGATCVDGINSFTCICGKGWTGSQCQVKVNPCDSSPCYGGATCRPAQDSFHCICPPGFSGRSCHTKRLPNFSLKFGNSPSTETLDYVLLNGHNMDLDEFTICFWMSSEDKDNYGTPFSYATKHQDNELTITDYNGFVLSVAGEKVVTDVTANDGLWHFICASWAAENGEWVVYKDGVAADSGHGLAQGSRIQGGGLIVIGQEQDEKGGKFSAAESFQGEMTRLDIWKKILRLNEINKLKKQVDPYFGDVIAWPDVHDGLRGQIKISQLKFGNTCPGLDSPDHGELQIQGKGSVSVGLFSCEEGYYLEGKESVECNVFGEWESDLPICRLINCGFPGYIENGQTAGFNYYFGDSILNSCNDGYKLSGPHHQTCLGSGLWSGERPLCEEIVCKNVGNFENGRLWIISETFDEDTNSSVINIGDTVNFECEDGFEMDGLPVLECLEDGILSDLPPICQPVPCSTPPIVLNGYVTGGLPDFLEQGTVLTFNCDPGYQIEEGDTALCSSRGHWSRPIPRCKPIICASPENVTNGKTLYGGTTFGQIANYKCKKGHYLLGPHNSTCTEIGVWEPPPPTCVPVDCGEPDDLPHGLASYEASTYKNVVSFTCEAGYTLRGPESRQCTSSGHWSRKQPQCVPVVCDFPGKVPMGNLVQTEPFGAGDEAVYSCIPGHVLEQKTKLVCDLSGKWVGDLPHCIPHLCTGPGYLNRGTLLIGTWTQEPISEIAVDKLRLRIEEKRKQAREISLELHDTDRRLKISPDFAVFYPVGSELILDCLSGYQLSGDSVNMCRDEETWQSAFPVCEEIVCPNIENIDNGKLTVEGFKFRQSVYYECEMGYSLVGSFSRTCMENGSWSGNEPSCTPKMCLEPQNIENGYLGDVPSVEYGSVITYTCQPGFQLLGGAERVCGHLGLWSGQVPLCVNTSQTCLVPQLISSGYVAFDGNLEVGSQAWYDCNHEYSLVGPRERTCLASGRWTGDQPMCTPRNCQEVRSIRHGTVVGSEFSLESSLQFSCDPGFKLVGESAITCTLEENWSDSPPICVPIICPEPDHIIGGRVRGSARRFGDSVSYECSSGNTLLGPKVRRCQSDGLWSGTNPYCASITCPELPEVPNGKTDLELRIPGEKARFRCDLGWTLQGYTNITCNSNGDWEGAMPSCEPTTCPFRESQSNATLLSKNNGVNEMGSKMEWTCPDGLILTGSNQMTCLPTGEWDIDPPQCMKPDCGNVIELNNGIIFGLKNTTNGTEVNFSCDNGYYKISQSMLQCSLNGDWTGVIPICSKYECSTQPKIENRILSVKPNGESYVHRYTCESQYEIVGEKLLTCLPNNKWSTPAPQCKLAFCPDVPRIPKMIYKKQKMRLGETIQFTCQTGFKLIGSSFVKCNHNGLWEKSFPTCQPKTCKVKQNIRHGRWTLIPSDFKKAIWSKGGSTTQYDDGSVVSVGDKIKVMCDPGYEVYGNILNECLSTTVLDSPLSKCRQSYCPALQNIEHGFLVNRATYKGASVSYRCRPGYKLHGQSKRKCRRNKTWSNSVPKCKILHCPEPHNMAHGEVEFDKKNLAYGTEIKYSCHLGYEMVGASTRICERDGHWQGAEPECTQIRCSVPKIPLHGQQEIQDLIVGGTISYNCNHGYAVSGARILTCLGNKTWSGPVPRCKRIFCKTPKDINNGAVSVTSLEYQANIEYQCNPGYNLVGHHTRSCLHTGLWSGPQPSCIAHLCPRIDISHAHIHLDGRVPGDVMMVTCDTGYTLVGSKRLVCQMSLEWTPALPTCELVNCGNPPEVEYAISAAGGFMYLDSAKYSCLPGYEMRGNNRLTCSANGKWSGVAPSCVPKPCGPLDPPKDSNVKFESPSGYDLGFGSIAHIECVPGYVSLKPSILACHEDGSWKGEIYQCIPIPCGSPPAPENGGVQVSMKGGQYLAEYQCEEGYILEGVGYLQCMADLQWQFGMPSCQPVDCGNPPRIKHGKVNGHSYKYKEKVEVQCDRGFYTKSRNEISCTANGSWKANGVQCDPVFCNTLTAPNHGNVVHEFEDIEFRDRVPWKGQARFTCKEGFQLFGASHASCRDNGTWSTISPQCQRIWCPAIESPQHTFMMGVGRQFRDVVRFACEQGYKMFGVQEVHCTHTGHWNNPAPSCHRVWCDTPILHHGLKIAGQVYSNYPHRTRLSLQCMEGHLMRGDLSIHCQANGRWSRPEGSCHRVSCGYPRIDAGVILLSNTFMYGAKVPYTCPSGQFPANSPLHCSAEGSWVNEPAKCVKL